MNREIIEKIIVSIVFGLIGFLLNFIPINYYFPPQKATFLFGLIFPMIITLAWGWKYGFLAATLGMGCQTMWFLWLSTSGWGSIISIPPFTLWVIWHGWCADQHRKKKTQWSKLYLAEIPFRIFNIIILYTVFRFIFQFNPPPWAPEVSNTVVPLEYINFIVVKEIINAYLILIICDAVLNLGKVRTFFKLKKKSEQVKTNYISSVSIIFGILFWITDGFLSYLIFESGEGSILDLIILNVPIHNLFTRITFLGACLIVGLILSNFFNKEQESQIRIQEQEKRIKDIAKNSLEWIWEIDVNGKYTYSSPVIKALLGYTHKEVLNRHFYDFFHPKDREQLKKAAFDIFAKKEPFNEFIGKYKHKNGKTVWLSTRGIAILDEKGDLLGYRGTDIDISTRKKAEKALQESEEKLRAVLDNATIHIWAFDGEHYTYLNRAWYHYTGQDLALPRTIERWTEVVHPDDLDKAIEKWYKARNNKNVYNDNFRLKNKEGEYRLFHANAIPIYDENGNFQHYQGYNIDITEEKRVEGELIESMEELVRSNEELKQFTYIASHDLQEPLRMIVSFIQLLEKRYKDRLDEEADDFINFIVDGAKRMQTLINDLLIYSRIGRNNKPFIPIDTNIVLKHVIDNLRKSIEDTNAKFTYDPLPTIIANETESIQLLQNLISNAIKFHKAEEPPIVHISANLQKNQWIFSIRDNGIGIDSQFFERIFIVFQRLHKKDEYGGTGIGLAICKKIVQHHKGKIWVESEIGKGSTFYFSIPKK